MQLTCQQFSLDLSQPVTMGILNTTPDSFSDGGRYKQIDQALAQVECMISQGASIIDIGGESTRPGASDVELSEELSRTIPVLKAIKARFNVLVSIDTSKAGVMSDAISHGVDIINDVCALQNEGCIEVAAQTDIPVCLMHMQGKPRTMQLSPQYDDVIGDIKHFFKQRLQICEAAGIKRDRIIIDPGFGFGKTLEQNYQLLANLSAFSDFNLPLLSGTSRKSMIGNLLNCDVEHRLIGSVTSAVLAAQQGARIIRVHDVKETADALAILRATTENK